MDHKTRKLVTIPKALLYFRDDLTDSIWQEKKEEENRPTLHRYNNSAIQSKYTKKSKERLTAANNSNQKINNLKSNRKTIKIFKILKAKMGRKQLYR